VGGYFGGWVDGPIAWSTPLEPAALRQAGAGFGCGVLSFLGREACGVQAVAQVMAYMAAESAAQCGPCVFGLRAIADATGRLAAGAARVDDLTDLERWTGQVRGRGACHHPDGAASHLASALRVFGDEFARHQARRGCAATGQGVRAS